MSSGHIIDQAFILAAGFGTRLRPETNDKPKPMVTINGQTLLDHTLDHLSQASITHTVINTHYLADTIEQHLRKRTTPRITLSHEPEILDSGGGIKNALPHLKPAPFFVLSGDGYWHNPASGPSSLHTLSKAWDAEIMDILILLQPVETMTTTKGVGDYTLAPNGLAKRSLDQTGTHMFTSMRINHPRIFDSAPDMPFSYLDLLDKAQAQGRLYGVTHHGVWHHISTPDDLSAVRKVEDHG